MIDLYKLSGLARQLAEKKQKLMRPSDRTNARAYAALHLPFNQRLLEACARVKDDPKGVPEVLFIAFPERLMGKVGYICGDARDGGGAASPETAEVAKPTLNLLRQYDEMGKDCRFSNLASDKSFEAIRSILICHGLSPIGDSIALLADIGRSFRAAWVTGRSMRVMLADISWMSSNRSIRQFSSLTPDDIDTGLRVCLDKRQRLYGALGIAADVHEILPYARAKKINGKKLQLISDRYRRLATCLWGKSALERLDHAYTSLICRPLDTVALRTDWDVPEHIHSLSQFPGALGSLESGLKPHLEILRAIAQQFSSFDSDVFTYFFAQYYAQDEYNGTNLKVAPVTEQNFDEPFQRLDPYFRAWGEGHTTAEVLAGTVQQQSHCQLSAVYLPQYQIGNLKVLPYTPLSLDALKLENKNHEQVREGLIMLDDRPERQTATEDLLRAIPVGQRNRLIADVVSFFLLMAHRLPAEDIDMVCTQAGLPVFRQALGALNPEAVRYFEMEVEAKGDEDVRSLWETWLHNLPIEEAPTFRPTNIHLLCMDEGDWTAEAVSAAAQICRTACSVYRGFLTV